MRLKQAHANAGKRNDGLIEVKRGAAARLVERWAQRFAREAVKDSYQISLGAKKPASLDFIP